MDIRKLKDKMRERDISVKELALKIGIDPSTLYRKLQRNGLNLTIGEVKLIVPALNLSQEEAENIFFSK